ncbi:MAG: radical SAM protein [Desulfobacteraceae bacterium]|nr:radical SAM protein [Desulfobacteraceae bacterium]
MTTTNAIEKTTRRILTRRGVLWLGQTCNLRCHFCYFLDRVRAKNHPEHPFMNLDKAKQICSTLVDTYGNNSIDIQGGEPTIHPDINALVRHCRDIGLMPTLITNAIVLSRKEKCQRLRDAGIRDMLISVNGLGETYDTISGVRNGHKRQMAALDNLRETGIPFRFNCVLAKSILPDLTEVARLAIESGARVMNFIAFNPFEDQQKNGRSFENVPSYMEVSGPLTNSLDLFIHAGVECNVRYYPPCMVEDRYRKYLYNFQQLPYDLHEWDYASWSWTGQQPQRMRDGHVTPVVSLREANTWSRQFGNREEYMEADIGIDDEYRHSAFIRAREHCAYQYAPQCGTCSVKNICDGFHGDYASLFSADEAHPVDLGGEVDDPLYYIREQEKVVEEEDWDWALKC